MRQTLKKSEILRGRKNFQLIFEQGRKIEGRLLRCYVLPGKRPPPGTRPSVVIGVATSRVLRRAVDRNRVKRLIRESYRRQKEIIISPATSGGSLLFLFSAAAARREQLPSYSEIEKDMIRLLSAAGRLLCG